MTIRAFTAVVHQEDDVYVADCPEVGTSSYGETIEEATELYLEEVPQPHISRVLTTTFEAQYAS